MDIYKCILCEKEEVTGEKNICYKCFPGEDEERTFVYCKGCGQIFFPSPVTWEILKEKVHKNIQKTHLFLRKECQYVITTSGCKKCDPNEVVEVLRIIGTHKIFKRKIPAKS